MPRPPFAKMLREFQTKFDSEEVCQEYLAACRWSDGFVCPRSAHRRVYESLGRRRWQCLACRHQVSLLGDRIDSKIHKGMALDNDEKPRDRSRTAYPMLESGGTKEVFVRFGLPASSTQGVKYVISQAITVPAARADSAPRSAASQIR